MRNISPAGLAQLATRYGNEPITIIEVDWIDGRPTAYADRTIGLIPGRIVEVGDLDDAVNISGNSDSQELAIVLDDTDGTIKGILDSQDVHKRDARVYQYFTGLDLSDKFLLFSGKISSPIIWNERDRTVKVTIISQLEDREIGFSAEEGQFQYLPAEMVNKPWPIIFGTVINNPCLFVTTAITGTTLTPVGILAGAEQMLLLPTSNDVDFEISLIRSNQELVHLQKVINAFTGVDDAKAAQYRTQYNAIYVQLYAAVIDQVNRQECTLLRRQKKINDANIEGLGDNPIKILGGEDFPQGQTVTIAVEGGLFTGYFDGNIFHISSRSNVELTEKASGAYNAKLKDKDVCSLNNTTLQSYWHWETPGPDGVILADTFLCSATISEDAIADRQPVIQQFWAEPGAAATLYISEHKTYIASITPGTILAVRAYKQVSSGLTRLVDVPTDLYTITTAVYGTITAVQIELEKQLSHILDEGWSDELFVTFQSSVGPNVADILAYIIDQYTDLEWDITSFGYVHDKLALFPANFPINERKNVVQTLQEIAFQARCAIWFSDGMVYLRYLPEEPTPAVGAIITESDIDAEKGVEVELTSTEELITKMVVNWHLRFATDDRPYTVTLRHNLKKYGTHEKSFNFYVFNQPDIVYKMATFWLIRKSNTWKRIKFTTPLHKLNLETFDAVTLDFVQPYVATGPITAIIESAKYNSATNAIDFICLTPVVAGTLTKYPYFWPSALATSVTWPPQTDIVDGNAGGGGIGSGASGALPIGDTTTISSGPVFIGGPNVVFGPHSDWGDPQPTDVGFEVQTIITPTDYTGSNAYARTPLDLTIDYSEPMVPIKTTATLVDAVAIDIHQTKFYDTSDGIRHEGYLSDLITRITEEGAFVLDGEVLIAADAVEARFDFKFDEDTLLLGAGTAFLQD